MKLKLTIDKGKPVGKIPVNITRLSYATGYNKAHISRVFSQKNNPSVTCLTRLAMAMGMGFEELHTAIKEGRINVANTKR
jgi:hypothetical protein